MSGLVPLLIIAALFIGMTYFLMVRPVRQRERKHDELVGDLERGDIVITAGGMYGQIERIDEDSVILKIESGSTIRIARGSVVGKQEKY